MKRLLSLLLVTIAVLLPAKLWAADGVAEPYAVLSADSLTVTFYYDDQKVVRGGIDITDTSITDGSNSPYGSAITAVFDSSIAEYKPTSTAFWFYRCPLLTSISGIENLKTENVTSMRCMFQGCSSLGSLNLSEFKTDNVTNMSSMFFDCNNLTTIDMSGFKTDNVTNMYGLFYRCNSLITLDLTNFNTQNVTDMRWMFEGCTALKTVLVGDGWTTVNIDSQSMEGYMFGGCTSLVGGAGTTYDANHTDYTYAHIDGGTANPGYFTDKNAAPSGNAEPYAVLSADSLTVTFYYDEQKTARGGIDINNGFVPIDENSPYGSATLAVFDASFADYRPTSTAYWFMECLSLASITGMENLRTDNVTDMNHMFDECRSLTSLDLSHFNTQNVTDMNSMFTFCWSLTLLDLSTFNTENVTDMSSMFLNCSGLTLLDVSGLNTAKVTNMSRMFEGCSSLTSLDVSTLNTINVTEMGGMFNGCLGLTSVNLSGLNTANVLHMSQMFERCEALPTLDISSFQTDKVTDMYVMFYGCRRLTTIYVGSGWSTTSVGDGRSMFSRCESLIGGAGTVWDSNNIDYTYAHIDGGTANPGYFTDKNAAPADNDLEIYVVQADSTILPNVPITATPSVIMTPGNDSIWSVKYSIVAMTEEYRTSGLGYLEFKANTYYPNLSTTAAFLDCIRGELNPKDGETWGTGTSYSTHLRNLPKNGTYMVFETRQDGSLIIPMRINSNKPLYVVDSSGKAKSDIQFKDGLGQTMQMLTSPLCAVSDTVVAGFVSFNVKAGEKYYVFNRGSKCGFGGYVFSSQSIEIDPATTANVLDSLNYVPTNSSFDSNGVLTVGGETTMTDALSEAGGVEEVAKTITAVVWNSTAQLTNSDLQGISNPNLLVYVNEASLAPSNVQNVVVNGTAREIVLTDATTVNNNFYVPQAFTAERISYTRNFAQSTQVGVSRGWESIALPFDVQTITHETKGTIAPFGNTASNRHFWLRELGSNGLQSATGIAANTPYVISMPNSSDYTDSYNLAGRVTFAAENATIPVTEVKASAMADQSIVMIPTMQRQERSSEVWALNVGEVRGRYLEGSVFERDYREVRPFEAYTVHREENSQPAPRYVPLQEIGGTTGINVMEDVRSKKDDVWYTTDGRKLQGKPSEKGVYINNGQKIVIR